MTAGEDPLEGGPDGRLSGRTALVTGGGSGLGATLAGALAEAGAQVVAVGRSPEPLARVAESVAESVGESVGGGAVRTERCDVADPESVDALAARLYADGTGVDVLVNNAGVPGPVAPLTEIEPAEWDEVFAVNVRGVYLMSRAFLPAMAGRGDGDILNIASVSGKRPLARRTPYCASKAALLGLTSALAAEAGPQGVRVNSLSPGPVDSARMRRNFRLEAARTGVSEAEAERAFVSRALLERMVTEREVADAAVALIGMSGLCAADLDLSAGMVAK